MIRFMMCHEFKTNDMDSPHRIYFSIDGDTHSLECCLKQCTFEINSFDRIFLVGCEILREE